MSMTSSNRKKGEQTDPDLPAVGSTVRYHGKATQYYGLYKVVAIHDGDEAPLEIENDARVMQVRVSTVTVESGPSNGRKKGAATGTPPPARPRRLVWYRGPQRQHSGVAR